MSLSLTTRYMRQHLRVKNISIAAMGFYLFLLSVPKDERRLPRYQLLDELKTGKDQLYKYIRELMSIGVLDIESFPGQPTEYTPHIYTKTEFIQKEGVLELRTGGVLDMGCQRIKPSNTIYISSTQPGGTALSDQTTRIECKGTRIKDRLGKIVKGMNNQLPRDERVVGKVPVTYQKKLLELDGLLDIEGYTQWFVRDKLENKTSSVYSFGWKIFLHKSMHKEYTKLKAINSEREATLQTTTKWKGLDDKALNAAQSKLDKLKKSKR